MTWPNHSSWLWKSLIAAGFLVAVVIGAFIPPLARWGLPSSLMQWHGNATFVGKYEPD